jgi:hypothetical protein
MLAFLISLCLFLCNVETEGCSDKLIIKHTRNQTYFVLQHSLSIHYELIQTHECEFAQPSGVSYGNCQKMSLS